MEHCVRFTFLINTFSYINILRMDFKTFCILKVKIKAEKIQMKSYLSFKHDFLALVQ